MCEATDLEANVVAARLIPVLISVKFSELRDPHAGSIASTMSDVTLVIPGNVVLL
jgi:hypothetical protein